MSDLDVVASKLAERGVAALADGLRRAEPASSIEKLALDLLAGYVEKHGLEGFALLKGHIERLVVGEDVDLDIADLQLRSDALALLERGEADAKSAFADALAKAGAVLGPIIAAIARAAAGAIIST